MFGRTIVSADARHEFVALYSVQVQSGLRHCTSAGRLLNTAVWLLCAGSLGLPPLFAAADAQETVVVSSQAADEDPAELIDAMSRAVRDLNYKGTFVHAQGTSLTSMQILHSNSDGDEQERLISLDGEAREVIRDNSLVTCIWPGTESVVVTKSKPRDLLPKIDETLTDEMRYSFSYGAPDRVASRDTYVINVTPTDGMRYGYRFWIDIENKMLLRSMLLDGSVNPVEQVIFTQIEYLDSVDSSLFDIMGSDRHAASMSWLEPEAADATDRAASQQSEQADRVSFSALPSGYKKISETYSPTPINKGPVSHVMLSDGMASVSVYVEYVGREDQQNVSLGWSRMGAMNAYTVGNDEALITVVGEVPKETVEAIAAAVDLAG